MKRGNKHHYIIHATGIAGIVILLLIRIFWVQLVPGRKIRKDDLFSEEISNRYTEFTATTPKKSTVTDRPRAVWTKESATSGQENPVPDREESPEAAVPGKSQTPGDMVPSGTKKKPRTEDYLPVMPGKIELNTADSAELVKLYGIGPYYAVSIIKYREKLGGFAVPEQLLEVKGMDRERLEGFYDRVFADTSFITRMDLRTATEDQLAQHLYIGRYLARCIVRYRETAGLDSCTLEHLVRDKVLESGQARKIGWYLY
ncbi:MAG TPA: helix-hairpin-helix domain-containing protein [Bacteroidales bacterium]|nr:MAG: Helix-hairpin-helix motif protein [Bacteroidetes bacterium ADurb.Bin139]HOG24930.1 helix-hairpin-helix domain-containing protein [Bacteroidales bacterium]HOR11865.1 helix-hairpin-helix domain-containing protein [Bacteroidales bacterium]HOZ20024.1 helix-hairpin-helix domain-containing protein [Bacteroidales bacterium]HPB77758.1 helix-hairpin-helix domain-containing protein [Bacteroidales bacterium]